MYHQIANKKCSGENGQWSGNGFPLTSATQIVRYLEINVITDTQ